MVKLKFIKIDSLLVQLFVLHDLLIKTDRVSCDQSLYKKGCKKLRTLLLFLVRLTEIFCIFDFSLFITYTKFTHFNFSFL